MHLAENWKTSQRPGCGDQPSPGSPGSRCCWYPLGTGRPGLYKAWSWKAGIPGSLLLPSAGSQHDLPWSRAAVQDVSCTVSGHSEQGVVALSLQVRAVEEQHLSGRSGPSSSTRGHWLFRWFCKPLLLGVPPCSSRVKGDGTTLLLRANLTSGSTGYWATSAPVLHREVQRLWQHWKGARGF